MDQLPLTGPAAAFNGGVFVRPDLSVMTQNCVAREDAIKVIDSIMLHGLDCWVYTERGLARTRPEGPHVTHEAWTVKFSPKVVSDFDSHMDRVAKIVGVSNDLAAVAQVRGRRTVRLWEPRIGGAFAALLSRCHASRREQGPCRDCPIAGAISPALRDRYDWRHAE